MTQMETVDHTDESFRYETNTRGCASTLESRSWLIRCKSVIVLQDGILRINGEQNATYHHIRACNIITGYTLNRGIHHYD
jgi:hypothetical protein